MPHDRMCALFSGRVSIYRLRSTGFDLSVLLAMLAGLAALTRRILLLLAGLLAASLLLLLTGRTLAWMLAWVLTLLVGILALLLRHYGKSPLLDVRRHNHSPCIWLPKEPGSMYSLW